MKLAVFVILAQFSDWEGAYLASQLNQSDQWQVRYAANQRQATSIRGMTLVPDYQLDHLPSKIDLLVLIGGKAWQLNNLELATLIQQRLQTNQPVAAICGAVDFLAAQGLLNNYQHTGNSLASWANFTKYRNSADFKEQQVVCDRNLVTANGTASLDFTETVLNLIHFSNQNQQLVDLYRLGFYRYVAKYGNPFA
ncbi:MAG: DJ-1/PfpI family protein [Lactobacillaceae bacterium]|jgi:putative intracellular protease/amidase|nr:DJ-1/PfpI family protein [Lactobacillaceae bacterium]